MMLYAKAIMYGLLAGTLFTFAGIALGFVHP